MKNKKNKLIEIILILNIVSFIVTISSGDNEIALFIAGLFIIAIPIMSLIALLIMNKKGEE